MSDSQYEGIVKLLQDIYNTLGGLIAVVVFSLIALIGIFLVVFFAYYDKELDRKSKQEDARIKRIIEEYKRDDSKV